MKPKSQKASRVVEKGEGLKRHLAISAPNFRTLEIEIEGTAPLVIHAFSEKARKQIRDKHEAGSKSNKNVKREPRDFHAEYEGAKHTAREGWLGFAAPGLRNGCISACRLVGFKMTIAKLSIFVEPDGFDRVDGTPLVRIHGKEREVEHVGRLADGNPNLIHRPMWDLWTANLRIRYDGDQFDESDVINLLMRVGLQVGLCEGRHDSKKSAGMGWGTFKLSKRMKVIKAA